MKRTARLVRKAIEGRAAAPDPLIRGAADVAAAVARPTTGPRHEGAPATGGRACGSLGDLSHAAGGPPGAITSRVISHAAGGSGVVSSRDRVHAAGGPSGGISPRALAHAAAGGPGAISTRDLSRAAEGGPGGLISSRGLAHAAAGGPPGLVSTRDRDRDRAHAVAGGPPGVISTRDRAHAAAGGPPAVISSCDAGGLGGRSGHDLAYAVLGAGRGSGRKATPTAVVNKFNGGGGAVQVDGNHYSLQGGQGGREAAEDLQQGAAKAGQGEVVGSKATAGLALAASLHTQGTDPTSSPKVEPLVIHDKLFVKGKDYDFLGGTSGDEEWATDLDVSEEITSQLTQSDRPVPSFTVDSSNLPNSACLEKWLDLLSLRSVQELNLLNLGHPVYRLFPIESIQSRALRHLRLGFFTVYLDLLCFNYSSLHTLEFFSCKLEGTKLSWVVTDCPSLKVLKVHHSCVDLHINSDSLLVLDSFGNIGNRLVIESAPNLESLSCGIMANQKSAVVRQKISASVYLHNVPKLKLLSNLNISYNKLILNNKDIAKDAVGPLPSLEELRLSLEMSSPMQLQILHKLLESFPRLRSLSAMRLDSVSPNEGFDTLIDKPFEDVGMVDCCKNCLTSFALQGFRGGKSEMHLIKNLLKNAPNLICLSTTRCESTPKKSIRYAVKEIESYYRASVDCQLKFE